MPAATALRRQPDESLSAAPVAAPANRSLLRFITCGSVDDGKSTLIGRVLFETGAVFEDQLDTLKKDSERFGTQGKNLDYALLVDGLSAEREQGITIDVAYRYFSTPRRAFIVADTPGHEQYTRNMATGASTADVAVILIDARKGVLKQTRRHSFIVSLVGVKRIIVAVSKMDLIGYDRAAFERIEAEYHAMAAGLGFEEITVIPVSALAGDNIAKASAATPWYRGPSLIALLEGIETRDTAAGAATGFALPVQWVNRPDQGFRGFAGTVASGFIRPGDTVMTLPSGRSTTVARIVTADGDLVEAREGQAITLTLAEEIDVSRGDVLVAGSSATASTTLKAQILCTGERPLLPNGRFLIKIGTASANATITSIEHGVDIETFEEKPVPALGMNAIGLATITLDRPVVALDYKDSADLGGFILIDPMTNATAAFGFVTGSGAATGEPETDPLAKRLVSGLTKPRSGEKNSRSIAKAVTWRITGSLDTFLLSFLFTSSAKTAAAISISEVATKIVLYYFHERIWTRIGFGLDKTLDKETVQSTDGAGI